MSSTDRTQLAAVDKFLILLASHSNLSWNRLEGWLQRVDSLRQTCRNLLLDDTRG